MLESLQITLTGLLIAYLAQWRYAQFKRNRRGWDEIVSALQATGWESQDVLSLRAVFVSAPFLVQLADYATEHSRNPDAPLLDDLRRDAFRIRLSAAFALVKHSLQRKKSPPSF